MHPCSIEDLWHTQPRTYARVPMGTGNEMVVTVSQPAKVDGRGCAGGWLLFSMGMIRAHQTPHRLCQQRQYATRSTDTGDLCEPGPVGTKVSRWARYLLYPWCTSDRHVFYLLSVVFFFFLFSFLLIAKSEVYRIEDYNNTYRWLKHEILRSIEVKEF